MASVDTTKQKVLSYLNIINAKSLRLIFLAHLFVNYVTLKNREILNKNVTTLKY